MTAATHTRRPNGTCEQRAAGRRRARRSAMRPQAEPLMVSSITGRITDVCAAKPDGTAVFRIRPAGAGVTVAVTAEGFAPRLGLQVLCTGSWERDAVHGRQFAARRIAVLRL